jgi:hypothetical protein
VFIRFVLDHEEYDRGAWKRDSFGANWKKRLVAPGSKGRGETTPKGPRRGRK